MNELKYFDAFDNVPNYDLEAAYFEACRDDDEDRELIEAEMIRRGLLGRC